MMFFQEEYPLSEEEIVPAPSGEDNPGTQEGVGERELAGMGTDGVKRIEGEFGDLKPRPPNDDSTGAGSSTQG